MGRGSETQLQVAENLSFKLASRVQSAYTANTGCRTNVGLMLGDRLRRRSSVKPAWDQRLGTVEYNNGISNQKSILYCFHNICRCEATIYSILRGLTYLSMNLLFRLPCFQRRLMNLLCLTHVGLLYMYMINVPYICH